jgi:hypothetical protein
VDGCEVHRNSEHYIWSSASFVSSGVSIWDTKYCFTTIPHRLMRQEATKKGVLTEITKLIAWQHEVLLSGVMPASGYKGEPLEGARARLAGSPICGPFRAAFCALKHDGKARKELHFFSRSYMSSFVCDSCLATQANPNAPHHLYYGDFSPSAPYRATLIDHSRYMEMGGVSPWIGVPGWRLELTFHDILHVLYLGILRDTCASALLELAMAVGGSLTERLAELTQDMRAPVRTPG